MDLGTSIKLMRQYLILGFWFLIFSNLYSQDKDTIDSKLQLKGSVDIYWRNSFNGTPSSTSMVFDHNSFSLGWLSVGLSKEGKKTGFETNIAFGPRSHQFYGGGDNPLSFIRDFYLYWNITSKLKATAGITQPFIGYEADEPHENINYSGSYAYSFLPPASLAGLQFEYALDESWTLLAGAYNASTVLIDSDNSKHIGGQVIYSKGKASSIRLGVLAGKEPDESDVFIAELVADFDITKRLFLASNLLFQNQKFVDDSEADWYMFDLYGAYELKKNIKIGLRAEYTADLDAALLGVVDNEIISLTATLNFQIESLKISPEIRYDTASKDSFLDKDMRGVSSDGHVMVGMMYVF